MVPDKDIYCSRYNFCYVFPKAIPSDKSNKIRGKKKKKVYTGLHYTVKWKKFTHAKCGFSLFDKYAD